MSGDDFKKASVLGIMTKRSSLFSGKNRVTPSVTVPGDTNVSDATAHILTRFNNSSVMLTRPQPPRPRPHN